MNDSASFKSVGLSKPVTPLRKFSRSVIRLPRPLEVLLLPPNKPLSRPARSLALAEVEDVEEGLDVVVLAASEAGVVLDADVAADVAAGATELATPVAASDALLTAAGGTVEAAAVLSGAAGTDTETIGVGEEAAAESGALAAPVSDPAADAAGAGAVVGAASGAVDATGSLGAFAAAAAAVVVLATLVETIAAAPWTTPADEPFPAAGEPTAKLASAAAVAIVEKTRIVVIVEVIHTRTNLYLQLPPPIVVFVE